MLKALRWLILIVAPVSSAVLAEEMPDPMWQDEWKCGEEVPLTRNLIILATEGQQQNGYAGDISTPPFFTAEQPMYGGSLLFVKKASGWAGYPLEEVAGADSVYAAPGGRTILFLQVNVEGPGPYTAVSTTDGFMSISCTDLDLPVSFPNNAYLDSFGGDASGKTQVLFTAEDDDGADKKYIITSTDFGKSWGSAVETSAASLPPGIYAPAPTSVDDLLKELLASLPKQDF